MSTRSFIGFLNNDGSVKYVYCHFDGYLKGVGAELNTYFNSPEAALKLIEGGDISSIREGKADYYKDRGDDWDHVKPSRAGSLHSYLSSKGIDYRYLFVDGKWTYSKIQSYPESMVNKMNYFSEF